MAGLEATVPMTVLMEVGRKLLPHSEQYPLPPWEIVDEASRKVGVTPLIDNEEEAAIVGIAHFAYGATMGAAFETLIRPQISRRSSMAAGAGWGLAVWAGSYLGLLPALRILTPATEHPARRNALMIAAHLVWGISLGFCSDLHRPARSDAER